MIEFPLRCFAELSKPVIQQPSVDKISLANKTSVDFPVGSDITVLTQTRVNITCQVDGLPKPEITWLKDGNPVAAETGNSLEMTISGVEDAGQVTCIAQNIMGNATLSSGIDVVGKETTNRKSNVFLSPTPLEKVTAFERGS